jgi:hypothetical protein
VRSRGDPKDLVAVFVDMFCWESFDDHVEGFRDLFGTALTLQSLVGQELHYPMRYVPEDPSRLGFYAECLLGRSSTTVSAVERTGLMHELFELFSEQKRRQHIQPLQLPPANYLVTLLHVGLVQVNIRGSREVSFR